MTRRLALLLLGAALLAAGACGTRSADEVPPPADAPSDPDLQGPDLFEDVTAASGIHIAYRNGEDVSPHLAILESLGGGIALIDYDGDGLLDVFVPGGGYFDGP